MCVLLAAVRYEMKLMYAVTDYARHRECLKNASELSSVALCSERLVAVYHDVYNPQNYVVVQHHSDTAAAATCT